MKRRATRGISDFHVSVIHVGVHVQVHSVYKTNMERIRDVDAYKFMPSLTVTPRRH